MTKFCTLYSSSSGNCTLISDNDTNILIDAGVSASKICDSLSEVGISPDEIDAILITHEHSDHICGLRVLCRKYNISVYASEKTAEKISETYPDISNVNIHSVLPSESFTIRSMTVRAFQTPHDSVQPFGYCIWSEDKKYCVATDTGTVTKSMLTNLAGAEAVLIESNHDEEMLKNGPYPYVLKKRILSDSGHLSNASCAWLSTQLALWGTKRIILGHLSEKNNTPQKAYESAKNLLESNGFKVGSDVLLKVAPKNEICSI